MPSLIEEQAPRSCFFPIRFIQIDTRSNTFDSSILQENEIKYRRLLDDVQPTDLYVCSNERHYAIIIKEAIRRGIRVHLFEEGAGSFKGLHKDYIPFPRPSFFKQIISIYDRFWKKNNSLHTKTAALGNPLCCFIRFLSLTRQTVSAIYSLPFFQEGKISRKFPEFAHGWRTFDSVFSSDTDLMRKIVKANGFFEVRAQYDDKALVQSTKCLVEKHGIDNNVAIYAAQKFAIDDEVLSSAIIDVLDNLIEITGWRVLIKPHPKEDPSATLRYHLAAAKRNNIDVIEGPCPPAEYLTIHSQCRAVISISSSTLIYAPQQKIYLRAISIGDEVLKRLPHVSGSGVIMIRQHMKIMRSIPHIETTIGQK